MDKPLISVIIASYNHEKFVYDAVMSVLNQTYSNIEVIVVDDASTDKSINILKNINDKRLRVISLKNNRQYNVRNLALKKIKGEYVAFQNSDDLWQKDKLMRQMTYLDKHREVGAVFTGVELINEKGVIPKDNWAKELFRIENRKRVAWLKYFLEYGNCLCISSSLVRKKIIDKVGLFNESLIQLSDFDLWIRVVAVSELHILEDKLTQVRIIGNKNLSAPNPGMVNRSTFELAQILHRYIETPVVEQLGEIIPGKIRNKIPIKIIQQCRLIEKCWEINTPAHILFSIHLGDYLLESTTNRKLISCVFGNSFIKNHLYIKSKLRLKII